MNHRVVTKRKLDSSVSYGYGITLLEHDDDRSKFKKARVLDLHHEVEDLREIIRYLDKGYSTSTLKMPLGKYSPDIDVSQHLRGHKLDRLAYRWWLSRFGIEDHVSMALLGQIQPERCISSYSVDNITTLPSVPVDANICTVNAPGAIGLRRVELYKRSGGIARHFNPILHKGIFSWGENFTFSSHLSEYRDPVAAPVDIDLLRPSALVSVPPVQRLHLVEPFRPVAPALKELVLERAHLLNPSENTFSFPSGRNIYQGDMLRSGRSILRIVSERIHVNGLNAIPDVNDSASSDDNIEGIFRADVGSEIEDSIGSRSESRGSVGSISSISPRLPTGSTLSTVFEGDEEADNEEGNPREGISEADFEYAFAAGYMLDPSDMEHMARQYDNDIEKEERSTTNADSSPLQRIEDKDEFDDGYDYDDAAYLQQTQELDANFEYLDGRQDSSAVEASWTDDLMLTQDSLQLLTQDHLMSSDSQEHKLDQEVEDAHRSGSENHGRCSFDPTESSCEGVGVRFEIADSVSHTSGRENGTNHVDDSPMLDDTEDSLPGSAKFQALENMLGRHLEGVMDAVLEMVLDFMEPYVLLAKSTSSSGDLEKPDQNQQEPNQKRHRQRRVKVEEDADEKAHGVTKKNNVASNQKKKLKQLEFSQPPNHHMWESKTYEGFCTERERERSSYFKAIQAAASDRVTWEHVLCAIQTSLEQGDDCGFNEYESSAQSVGNAQKEIVTTAKRKHHSSDECYDDNYDALAAFAEGTSEDDKHLEFVLGEQFKSELHGSQKRTCVQVHDNIVLQ